MDRGEGVTAALYSGSNSWNNGYDTFDGKIGDNVFYYDLSSGSFQTSKGVVKTTVSTEETTSLPLQLRFAGPADAVVDMKWVATFRDVAALEEAVKNGGSGVESIIENAANSRIYNLMGIDCGDVTSVFPKVSHGATPRQRCSTTVRSASP